MLVWGKGHGGDSVAEDGARRGKDHIAAGEGARHDRDGTRPRGGVLFPDAVACAGSNAVRGVGATRVQEWELHPDKG